MDFQQTMQTRWLNLLQQEKVENEILQKKKKQQQQKNTEMKLTQKKWIAFVCMYTLQIVVEVVVTFKAKS